MNEQWQTVAEPESEAGAQVLVGLLQSESIPARIKADVPVPGLGISFRVEVPAGLVFRAEEVLRSRQISEEELTLLAVNSKEPGQD
jgi:hypothetical protein